MVALTDEQEMLVREARRLAENEFSDDALAWEGEYPWTNVELLADAGFYGVNFDEEYGGAGMTEMEVVLLVEAIGEVCPDTAHALNMQHMVAPRTIQEWGSDEVKETYLPPVVAGEDNIAIAISEPEAGSDITAMTTTVTDDGGTLVVNGEKTWVSNFPESSAAVVWVKFPEGLGIVVVDLDAPGIEVAEHFTNMAGHTQSQFFLNDVEIPERNVLVRGRDAFKKQLTELNWERLGIAAVSNAAARCALNRSLSYAKQRVQFDQPVADFQGIEWKLVEMLRDVEASRALTYRAAEDASDRGDAPRRIHSSLAKLHAAQMLEHVASEAVQIHGANGYQRGHGIEYLYRFGRRNRLAGGTDEIQMNTIAKALKEDGLPDRV